MVLSNLLFALIPTGSLLNLIVNKAAFMRLLIEFFFAEIWDTFLVDVEKLFYTDRLSE